MGQQRSGWKMKAVATIRPTPSSTFPIIYANKLFSLCHFIKLAYISLPEKQKNLRATHSWLPISSMSDVAYKIKFHCQSCNSPYLLSMLITLKISFLCHPNKPRSNRHLVLSFIQTSITVLESWYNNIFMQHLIYYCPKCSGNFLLIHLWLPGCQEQYI